MRSFAQPKRFDVDFWLKNEQQPKNCHRSAVDQHLIHFRLTFSALASESAHIMPSIYVSYLSSILRNASAFHASLVFMRNNMIQPKHIFPRLNKQLPNNLADTIRWHNPHCSQQTKKKIFRVISFTTAH